MAADKAGVSKDTISRAENCKPVRLGIAETIASTYAVELATLTPLLPGSSTSEQEDTADPSARPPASLIAIGPNIICVGRLTQIAAGSWTVELSQFLVGDLHTLTSFIGDFETCYAESRYILSNELGDGRVLVAPPSLTRQADGYSLLCPIAPCSLRMDVQKLGNSLASHPDTNDIYLDNRGNMARVAGLDYFPQRVREVLSMQLGESPFFPSSGVRLFQYFGVYRGSLWLDALFKLEIVRQASIPLSNPAHTPLRCVTRVRNVEVASETPVKNRLPVRVDFEVQGLGPWQQEVSIYMPTPEQMAESAKRIAQHRHVLGSSIARKS